MVEAIKKANLAPEILEELGDIKTLVAGLVVGLGIATVIFFTGVGAVVEAIIAGLLLIGAATSGLQIGEGINSLMDFYQKTANAQTENDLADAGKSFADGIAKMGVGGLDLLLSVVGARKASVKGSKPSKVDVAIETRRAENAKLRESPKFREDMKKVGISEEQIAAMLAKEFPLGFKNKEQFQQFKQELDVVLKQAGLDDAEIGMKGTATTFYSENVWDPLKPLGHHWDANPIIPGDYDLNITSSKMASHMKTANISPSEKTGLFKTRDVEAKYPELESFVQKWTKTLGREVNFVGYPAPQGRDATELILRTNK